MIIKNLNKEKKIVFFFGNKKLFLFIHREISGTSDHSWKNYSFVPEYSCIVCFFPNISQFLVVVAGFQNYQNTLCDFCSFYMLPNVFQNRKKNPDWRCHIPFDRVVLVKCPAWRHPWNVVDILHISSNRYLWAVVWVAFLNVFWLRLIK